MKILFTGFTSRTIGSDRNVYDYISNVFVLEQALRLAGHEVDVRPVSLTEDPCIDEDYDAAIVGIAACQGLSSRFKLGALWALHKFGKRAAIFPSDGKNVYTFPSSVRTCLTGDHTGVTPIEYFLGALMRDRNNIVDRELGNLPEFKETWLKVLLQLPHTDVTPKCAWPVLVPTHSWGNPRAYSRHFGGAVTVWDPTNIAIPMQFGDDKIQLSADGRLKCKYCLVEGSGVMSTGSEMDQCFCKRPRQRGWVLSTLQDQEGWLKKQKCGWPVVTIGNKRKAAKGEGVDYVPERELIEQYYTKYWGHLAFGYPLADGGWWRMRYVHAAKAGIVTCCDQADAQHMPLPYQHSRVMLERKSDEALCDIAQQQHDALMASAWPQEQAVAAVDTFMRSLV